LPGGKENTVVSFTQREPDTASLAAVSGQTSDRLASRRQQMQPSNSSVEKQDRCPPQKRRIHSAFDNTTEKLIPQTTLVFAADRFRTQACDSKFLNLYVLKYRLLKVEILSHSRTTPTTTTTTTV